MLQIGVGQGRGSRTKSLILATESVYFRYWRDSSREIMVLASDLEIEDRPVV